MSVFALFFDIAIAYTAIVHLLNNLFKLTLAGRKANIKTVLHFGLQAILFAFSLFDLIPKLKKVEFDTKYLPYW